MKLLARKKLSPFQLYNRDKSSGTSLTAKIHFVQIAPKSFAWNSRQKCFYDWSWSLKRTALKLRSLQLNFFLLFFYYWPPWAIFLKWKFQIHHQFAICHITMIFTHQEHSRHMKSVNIIAIEGKMGNTFANAGLKLATLRSRSNEQLFSLALSSDLSSALVK